MAQEPRHYGVITSLDLIKQGSSHHGAYTSKRQLDVDSALSSGPRDSIIARHTERLSIRADNKRPRLDLEDSIEASEICNATE